MLETLHVIQWKDAARKFARAFAILLFLVVVALIAVLSLPKRHQQLSINHDFGIGFDLNPAYGTVAVSFPNGSIRSVARIEGDAAYKEMMFRLSLPSSQHLHQPYGGVGGALGDLPRHMCREFLKKIGLPASKDVGTLSKMVESLREEASAFVGRPISAGTISIPRLVALYGEDLIDTFYYLSLVYIEFFPFYGYRPIHSTVAAYAGNGFGLCADYTNATTCRDEERQISALYALAISYTHAGLITSLARLSNVYYLEETTGIQDLKLGYDARHDNSNEDFYWESVRDALRFPILASPIQRNITMVLVSGDAANIPRFREILSEAVTEVINGVPVIADYDSVYAAAKGVAELAKRVTFAQRGANNDSGLVPELR